MPRAKRIYFLLEGSNAFATLFFFSYFQFLLRDEFGFGRRETLAVGGVHGLLYAFSAWRAGRFAERHGKTVALATGFVIMLMALASAGFLPSLLPQIACMLVWTVGMSFTWPALEALVSDGENDRSRPRVIGIYNLVWAGMAGLGYFSGGAIYEHLGQASLYWLPLTVLFFQLLIAAGLIRAGRRPPAVKPLEAPAREHAPESIAYRQPVRPATFLKMAWLANPFAYLAINSLLLIIPDLARRFDLSPTLTGIFCSVWLFTRFAAFGALWRWTGWHYRFRWLLGSFLALVASFFVVLMARELWLVMAAQILFGAATGLIYYSSLFYSMDVGENTSAEHGGIHEMALGIGMGAGPLIGAAALHFYPHAPNIGAFTVTSLLVVGAFGLIRLRWKGH